MQFAGKNLPCTQPVCSFTNLHVTRSVELTAVIHLCFASCELHVKLPASSLPAFLQIMMFVHSSGSVYYWIRRFLTRLHYLFTCELHVKLPAFAGKFARAGFTVQFHQFLHEFVEHSRNVRPFVRVSLLLDTIPNNLIS